MPEGHRLPNLCAGSARAAGGFVIVAELYRRLPYIVGRAKGRSMRSIGLSARNGRRRLLYIGTRYRSRGGTVTRSPETIISRELDPMATPGLGRAEVRLSDLSMGSEGRRSFPILPTW
jgi:hypothetical protein